MDAPKVVYIGGHGRSGTTILDRVLAEENVEAIEPEPGDELTVRA